MPRGRRKGRGGSNRTDRQGSLDSSMEGPREKETRLSDSPRIKKSVFDNFFRSNKLDQNVSLPPTTATSASWECPPGLSPAASSSSAGGGGDVAGGGAGRDSPAMPLLQPEVPLTPPSHSDLVPTQLVSAPHLEEDCQPPTLVRCCGDGPAAADSAAAAAAGQPDTVPSTNTAEEDGSDRASDRSEGDSGKENDVEDIPWRGSRSSLASRSSRSSRPRSGPFNQLNNGNIPGPSLTPFTLIDQKNNRITTTTTGETNEVRVTRSSRNSAVLASPPPSPSPSPRVASSTPRGTLQQARTTPAPLSPVQKNEASLPQSPMSPHKIQLPQRKSITDKLKSTFSKSPKSFSTKKGTRTTQRKTGTSGEAKLAPSARTKAEKMAAASEGSRQITDFFPIRRSERKPKSELDKDKMEDIEARLLATEDSDLGIEVREIPGKGRGVMAVRSIKKGEFVVEYAGELIDIGSAKDREAQYSLDTSKGCYMYYFNHREKQYCIDATTESGRYGRLLNHSCKTPNCVTKVVMLGDTPRLILVAKQDIAPQTELLYDYGDRSKESLLAHPWLSL